MGVQSYSRSFFIRNNSSTPGRSPASHTAPSAAWGPLLPPGTHTPAAVLKLEKLGACSVAYHAHGVCSEASGRREMR